MDPPALTAPVLVGIDSGGTRTNVEGRDGGTKMFSFEVPDVLSDAVHRADIESVLRRIVRPLDTYLRRSGLASREIHVFLSSAGFSTETRPRYVDAIGAVSPWILDGAVTAFGAANDAVTLLLGYDCDGVAIAGTGSNVLMRRADGSLKQSGGYGWVASDEGSGFWIGLRGIREACRDFNDEVESSLLGRFMQLYGLRRRETDALVAQFLDLCVADPEMPGEIARFASSICAAAESGDPVAQNIVKEEAETLADSVARAMRRDIGSERLSRQPVLVAAGSLLCNEIYWKSFDAQVRMRLRSRDAEPPEIAWTNAKTCLEASLNLAGRLSGDLTEFLEQVEVGFRPIVVRRGRQPHD